MTTDGLVCIMETVTVVADFFTVICMALCWSEVRADRNGRTAMLLFMSLLLLNIVALMR